MESLPNELLEYVFNQVCDLDSLSKTSVRFRNITRSLQKHYFNIHVRKFALVLNDIKSIKHEIIKNESTLLNGNNLTKYSFCYGANIERRNSNTVFKFYINTSKKINLNNFNHCGVINMMKKSNNGWVNEPHNVYMRDQSDLFDVSICIQEYNNTYSMILTENPPRNRFYLTNQIISPNLPV